MDNDELFDNSYSQKNIWENKLINLNDIYNNRFEKVKLFTSSYYKKTTCRHKEPVNKVSNIKKK